jgi:nucleoside-diphosphate-sugar epimerase
MKVLFVGGTGFISTSVTRLAVGHGIELYHLNRGRHAAAPAGIRHLLADVSNAEEARRALGNEKFDVVVDWVAYAPPDVERDLALFRGRARQYIFISSASVYQKPPTDYVITEATPLVNPHWEYSRNKIACEERLMQEHREHGFPVTIVRPSLTYDMQLPIAIGGWGCYTLVDRLKRGRPIIVHGDGSSLWVNTHAEDFARGFLGLVGNSQAIGHAFHITTDEVLTWNQIYQELADAVGAGPKMVHIASETIVRAMPSYKGSLLGDKTWSTVFDNSKIKRFVPGFAAQIPFREGIRRTVAWLEADPRRQRIDEQVNREMDHILEVCAPGSLA